MVRIRPSLLVPAALLALALAAPPPPALASDGTGSWTEPATGQSFPLTATPPGAASPLALTGGGVRTKLVFKVYALGFYVDPAEAAKGLAAFAGKPADALRADPKAYGALIDLPADKLVVMKYMRDLEGAQVAEALDDAVSRVLPSSDPARGQFKALWKDPIKKGDEASIFIRPSGEVSVFRSDRLIGTVLSKGLGHALLLAWLGPDPVSDSIRKGSMERLPALLAAK